MLLKETMCNLSRTCENDKQQDTGGGRLLNRKCNGIINKARFGKNTGLHKQLDTTCKQKTS